MKRKFSTPHSPLILSLVFALLVIGMIVFVPPQSSYLILLFNASVTLAVFFFLKYLKVPRWILPVAIFLGLALTLQSFAFLTLFQFIILVALAIGIMILLR